MGAGGVKRHHHIFYISSAAEARASGDDECGQLRLLTLEEKKGERLAREIYCVNNSDVQSIGSAYAPGNVFGSHLTGKYIPSESAVDGEYQQAILSDQCSNGTSNYLYDRVVFNRVLNTIRIGSNREYPIGPNRSTWRFTLLTHSLLFPPGSWTSIALTRYTANKAATMVVNTAITAIRKYMPALKLSVQRWQA